jgi:hypothetical protein
VALPPSPRMAFFGDPELVRRQHLRQTIERDKKRVAEKTAAAAYEELNRRRRAKKSRTSRAPSQSRFGRHSGTCIGVCVGVGVGVGVSAVLITTV